MLVYWLGEVLNALNINGKSYRFKPVDLDKKQIDQAIFSKYILTSIFQFITWAIIWFAFAMLIIRHPKIMDNTGVYIIMPFVFITLFIYMFYQIKIGAFMRSIYSLKLQNNIITTRQGLWFLILAWVIPFFNFILGIIFYRWKNKSLIAQGYVFVNVKKLNQQTEKLLLEAGKD